MDNNTFLSCNANQIFSIECFPVNSDKEEVFLDVIQTYCKLGIASINITCKPGHTENTIRMVNILKQHTDLHVIPHIVANLLTRKELDNALQVYSDLGIKSLFVLGGDQNNDYEKQKQDFVFATDLVTQIKKWDSSFDIGVAGYPEGHFQEPNCIQEMIYLKQKVDAGADYMITQLFFDNNDFYKFVERCRIFDINIPIIPGITYLKDNTHLKKIASLSLGSTVPNDLLRNIYINNDKNFGEQWLYKQIEDLVTYGKIPLIHLYIFNITGPFPNIIKRFR